MSTIVAAIGWSQHPDEVHSDIDRMRRKHPTVAGAPAFSELLASAEPAVVLGTWGTGPRSACQLADCGIAVVSDLVIHDYATVANALRRTQAQVRCFDDATLVGMLYARHGADAGNHIIGEGTVALWDAKRRQAWLWRDVAGVRPLYYADLGRNGFVACSDLRPFDGHPSVPQRLDLATVRARLEDGADPPSLDRTFREGVLKLRPGHQLLVEATGISSRAYWQPQNVPNRRAKDPGTYAEELRELLRTAIDQRVDRAIGVGAHLSGGLDSSTIASIAAARCADEEQPLPVYSWAPSWSQVPKLEVDERRLVYATAAAAPVSVHHADPTIEDLAHLHSLDLVNRPTTTLEAELSIMRIARAHGVSTILSGWGGDETIVFNGRGYFADLARRGHLLKVRRELRLRQGIQGGSLAGAWKSRVFLPLRDEAFGNVSRPSPHPLPVDLRPELLAALRRTPRPPAYVFGAEVGVRSVQERLLYRGHLQYRMESWAAHGNDHGIRHSFPMLDRRMIEFALSLPEDAYFRDGWKRWLFRTATEGIVPDEVRWYPHKQDVALVHRLNQLAKPAHELIQARLRARSQNPYVDVERLIAGDRAPDERIGSGYWLAFTDLGINGSV